jgi:hypothetical protein
MYRFSLSRRRRRCGVLAQVADQADDILGDEPANGAAGVDADHHTPGRVEDEPGGLQEERVIVDEGPGHLGDRAGAGAVPDRERQAVPGDQFPGGGLVWF